MNENEINNIQETGNGNNTINYAQQNFQYKKKNKLIWIIPIVLIIIIGAVIVGGYIFLNRPEQYYKRIVTSMFKNIEESTTKATDFETLKTNIKLDADVETELIEKEILDLINKTEIELGAQIDKDNKEVVADVNAEYDNDDLLDLRVFANVENKEIYVYAKEYFDKYLKMELDEENIGSLEALFESEGLSEGQQTNLKKGFNIIRKEMCNIIKAEYCSAEQATVEINGKDVKARKNTIKMTIEQMANETTKLYSNLKENEEFLNCMKNKDEMIDLLEVYIEQMEAIAEEEGNDENAIQINTYTTGLLNKFVKVEIILLQEDEELMTIDIAKVDEEKLSIELLTEEDKAMLTGAIKVETSNENTTKIKFEAEIEGIGSCEIDLKVQEEYNVKIDEIDEDEVVNVEDLTEQELSKIMQNLQKSELYKLIEKFSDTSSDDSLMDDYTFNIEDDENSTIDIQDNTTSSLSDNQILTYDKNTLITFGIPSGYSSNRISDNYKTLRKDDTSIDISTTYYYDDDGYYETIKSSRDYYLESEYYKNVTLSDKKTLTVNGKTFNYATLKYASEYNTYRTDYIWIKISDDYILEFRITGFDQMTESEVEKLLTINVKNK